jgi:hypothetical protein
MKVMIACPPMVKHALVVEEVVVEKAVERAS